MCFLHKYKENVGQQILSINFTSKITKLFLTGNVSEQMLQVYGGPLQVIFSTVDILDIVNFGFFSDFEFFFVPALQSYG